MNEYGRHDMFKQLIAQVERDSITNFDDIENFVRMYTIEYRRQLKKTNKPDVRFFTRAEIKEKIYQPYKIKVGGKVLKVIEDKGQKFYSVYDLAVKFASTRHAITPSTLIEDVERIAGDEVFSFKTSNYNAARYITKTGVKKTHNLMKYRFYNDLMNNFG